MSNSYDNAFDAVMNKNPAEFQDAVGGILADKLRERIGVEKVAVAQSFLNEPEAELEHEEQEEVADEEV